LKLYPLPPIVPVAERQYHRRLGIGWDQEKDRDKGRKSKGHE